MEEKDLNTTQTEEQVQDTPATEGITEAPTPESEDAAQEAADATPGVEEQLTAAQAEIAELKDKILRQAADFANFRKHSMATHTDLVLNGGKKVIEQLLPILDDMERAKKMDTNNAAFDTDYHEAVALFPTEEAEKKNHVIDCVQTGYLLNDKVLRHAKVVVGQ